MRAIRRTIAAAALAGLALAGQPREAKAIICDISQLCTLAVENAELALSTQILISELQIEASITAMQLAIIAALQLHAGQINIYQSAQTEAIGRFQTNAAEFERQKLVEREYTQATNSAYSGPSACSVLTGTLAAGGSTAAATFVRGTGAILDDRWQSGGASGAVSRSQLVDARIQQGAPFCDAAESRAGLDGCSFGALPERLVSAHVNVSKSLFDETNPTLTGEQATAAELIVKNITMPNPLGGLDKDVAKTANGRALIAERQKFQSRTSVANDIVLDIWSRRQPMPAVGFSGGQTMSGVDWARAMSQNVVGYPAQVKDQGVSQKQWMDLNAQSWFMNPNWQAQIATGAAGPEQLLKEMTVIMAFSVYQQNETYKLLEKIATASAAQLAATVENGK